MPTSPCADTQGTLPVCLGAISVVHSVGIFRMHGCRRPYGYAIILEHEGNILFCALHNWGTRYGSAHQLRRRVLYHFGWDKWVRQGTLASLSLCWHTGHSACLFGGYFALDYESMSWVCQTAICQRSGKSWAMTAVVLYLNGSRTWSVFAANSVAKRRVTMFHKGHIRSSRVRRSTNS